MKKLFLLLISMVAGAITWVNANDVTSHTFFTVRPVYQTAMPEKCSFFRNDLLENCYGGALELVPFGGRSTNSEGLAKFFLPSTCDEDSTIAVAEFPGIPNGAFSVDGSRNNDVEARHFNIQTKRGTFRSNLQFIPQQRYFGFGITYRQRITKCNGRTGWWFEFSTPIMHVKNQICLKERIIDDGGGANGEIGLDNSPRVANMIAAFKQRNWKWGRIDNSQDNVKTALGDIELKIGYNTINNACCQLNSYFGAILPTGNKPRSEMVFEAVVGNNHHYGFMFGNAINFDLWSSGCWALSSKWDVNNRYMFRNHQTRAVDLVGKEWSRYMETYSSKDQAVTADLVTTPIEIRENSGTSGINVFTRRLRVDPQFSTDINTAWVLSYKKGCGMWIGEAGFNFYARQAEKLTLDCCAVNGAALKSVLGLGRTTFTRTIRDNVPCADFIIPNYKLISVCDFDLASAAHPAILSYILYGAVGYKWCGACPATVALGGSYETESVNTVLRRWMVWSKLVLSF